MREIAFGESPFLHPAFVEHGRALPGQGPLEQVQNQAGKLVYEELRPAFLLGRRMLRIWAHDYAPLGGMLRHSSDDFSYQDFASLLDDVAQSSEAGLLFWPFFCWQAPFKDWITRWGQARGFGDLHVIRLHERAICEIERDVQGRLSAANGGDHALMIRPKKRKEYARQLRRLADLGVVEFGRADHANDLERALEGFLELEAMGWKGERGTALNSNQQTLQFVRSFLPKMAQDGQAQIDWLAVDGQMIASLISLRAGAGLFTWKIAFDPAYGRYSPGVQIMLHVTQDALEDPELGYLDSLASADHPMVDHLWAGRRPMASLLIPLNRSGIGSAKLAKTYYQGRDALRVKAKVILKR